MPQDGWVGSVTALFDLGLLDNFLRFFTVQKIPMSQTRRLSMTVSLGADAVPPDQLKVFMGAVYQVPGVTLQALGACPAVARLCAAYSATAPLRYVRRIR